MLLLDWEISTLGHPYCDLNYCGGQLRNAISGPRSAGREGIPSEWEFVQQYFRKRELPTIDRPAWSFFTTLNLFRTSAIVHGVLARGLSGNASGGTKANERMEANFILSLNSATQRISEVAPLPKL